MNNDVDKKPWPKTIEEAVDRILLELPEVDKEIIKNTPTELELYKYHDSLGRWVRNNFGLYQGNNDLLQFLGLKRHPDDVSMGIIKALWNRLREEK
jgi:hypothetical protein